MVRAALLLAQQTCRSRSGLSGDGSGDVAAQFTQARRPTNLPTGDTRARPLTQDPLSPATHPAQPAGGIGGIMAGQRAPPER